MTKTITLEAPVIVPLKSHAAICAALALCSRIGDDAVAYVAVRGYGGETYGCPDWKHWTAVYLEEFDLDEMRRDDDYFSSYRDAQLWIWFEAALTRPVRAPRRPS